MPKTDKPRHRDLPEIMAKAEEGAVAYLERWNLSDIREVTHFSDGSMSILHSTEAGDYHTGIEFDAPLTSAIARLLTARGVEVRRG